jgi:hypothetical protein
MKVQDMSDDDLVEAAHNMGYHGGGFAEAIASAYFRAGKENQQRLLTAFGHLFEKYAPGQGWGRDE